MEVKGAGGEGEERVRVRRGLGWRVGGWVKGWVVNGRTGGW